MGIINVEIKARCDDHDTVRKILKDHKANLKGIDRQIDTYFNVPNGRMKLREGNIENYLIHYIRENKEGPKQSDIILYASDPESTLKPLLTKALGVLVIVDKQREISFIDNVKFHVDTVEDLGTFVEIEAIDKDGSIGRDTLLEQCQHYLKLLNIQNSDLLSVSYSDLLLERQQHLFNTRP